MELTSLPSWNGTSLCVLSAIMLFTIMAMTAINNRIIPLGEKKRSNLPVREEIVEKKTEVLTNEQMTE